MSRSQQLIRTEWAETHPLLTKYYDEEWGLPVYGEQEIFERISLEALQSGLSWLAILKRRETIREAFNNFDPDRVADFDEEKIQQILQTEGVIKNRNKIQGIIRNAKITQKLRSENGLSDLFWSYMPELSPCADTYKELPTSSPESKELALELKGKGFSWVGPTTMYAAMGAVGMVDQHIMTSYRRGCSGLWNVDGTRVA